MSRAPGSKLGPYEIIAPLAASGGGETYKAADSQLNRTVTITVLPAAFSQNPALSERLEREAQTLASLKHPHIGAVYGTGREDGAQYIVAEYIEGQTLAERLSGKPLDWNEALKIAIAIADALDKAHRKGVAHRALNPSNIIVTAGGVKLLDFGWSAISETKAPAEADSMASTRTAPLAAIAAPGALLPYQSPEQLAGKDGDARSDIFAFGAILYEMVTGKRAFEGKTQALVIAAIATIDPDPVSKTQSDVPPALDYVVERCLDKNPKQRIQTAWDLLSQLQWIAEGGGSAGISSPWALHWTKRGWIYRIALAVAALIAAVAAPAAWLGNHSTPEAADVRFMISNFGFTAPNGTSTSIGMSPNGRWLVTSQGTGGRGLDAFAFGSPGRQVLLGQDVPYLPFWRPDTEEIGFFEEGNLKKAPVSGGPAQNLCPAPPPWGGGTWSSRGVIVFSSEGVLHRVLEGGGPPEAITALDKSQQETEHLAPMFLPDGRHYLFLALSAQREKSAIYLGSLDSNQRTRLLVTESRTIFAEPGYLIYNRGDAIFARAFDRDKLTLQGEERRVVDGVPTLAVIPGGPTSLGLGPSGVFAASQTGVLAYRIGGPNLSGRGGRGAPVGNAADMSLVLFDRTSRTPVGPPGPYAGIDLAPDGKRFAVHRHDGDGGDIWLYDADQGRMLRWTDDPTQENSSPVWSPDGKRIAFASMRNGKWGIYVRVVDKSAKEELIIETGNPAAPMNWTKSDQLVYWVADPKTAGDIWAVSVTGDHKAVPIVQTPNDERFPQVSPDGRWIAYTAVDAMGTSQIFVDDFPKGPGHWQITNEGGNFPRWGSDGKELFFVRANMWAVDIHVTGSSITPGEPHELFPLSTTNLNSSHIQPSYLRYAVSKDGQRFLIPQVTGTPNTAAAARGVSGGRLNTLAEGLAAAVDSPRGGAAAAATGNDIAVVLNWTRMLKPK